MGPCLALTFEVHTLLFLSIPQFSFLVNLQYRSGRPTVPDVSGYDILWAEVEGENIEFSYVDRRVKGKARLARIYARVLDENLAKDWCEKVMQTAYAGAFAFRSCQ